MSTLNKDEAPKGFEAVEAPPLNSYSCSKCYFSISQCILKPSSNCGRTFRMDDCNVYFIKKEDKK